MKNSFILLCLLYVPSLFQFTNSFIHSPSQLEDATFKIRKAMHLLLTTIRLSNIQSTFGTIQALLHNLSRYPSDRDNIYNTLKVLPLLPPFPPPSLPPLIFGLHIYIDIFFVIKCLAQRHSDFVEYLIEHLLKIDLKYAQAEQNVNDPHYIGKLIVVCNASIHNEKLLSFLPKHTGKHYRYLSDKFPQYFPSKLPFDQESENKPFQLYSIDGEERQIFDPQNENFNIHHFFYTTWEKLLEKYNTYSSHLLQNFSFIEKNLHDFTKNLQQFSNLLSKDSVFIKFYCLLHEIYTLILQGKSNNIKEQTNNLPRSEEHTSE